MSNNSGSTLAKLLALIGGTITGIILAELIDRKITAQNQARYDYDKHRYAQGYGIQEHAPVTTQDSFQENSH